jgi:hypothetical protein
MILILNNDYFLNSTNQLIFLVMMSCVFFVVWTEFLYIIYTSFSLKRLIQLPTYT